MRFALRAESVGAWRGSFVFVLGLALAAASTPATFASHIVSYTLDDTGNSAKADGAAADAAGNPLINFYDNNGAAADLHAGPGSGVSGAPDDRAFDNTASNGILTGSHGRHAADFDAIDGL